MSVPLLQVWCLLCSAVTVVLPAWLLWRGGWLKASWLVLAIALLWPAAGLWLLWLAE